MKKIIGSVLLLTMLFAFPLIGETKETFSDVKEGYWAFEEIEFLVEKGIINGYQDGTFQPQREVNRGQTAKMIALALDLERSVDSPISFTDVNETDSYYPYIQAVANNEIMKGRSNTFDTYAPLSRAQMAVTLNRAFPFTKERDVTFSDVPKEYWAFEDIQILASNGITTGFKDGTFGPTDTITRAQFAVFLARALEEDFRVQDVNSPPSHVDSEKEAWKFLGIGVGDSLETLQTELGEPEAMEESRYNFQWHVYHNYYQDYVQYGIQDGKVVAVYSNQDTWRSEDGLVLDKLKRDVIATYGDPLTSIEKGNYSFSLNTETSGTYIIGDQYVTFFYDAHRDHRITAVLIIDQAVEEEFQQYYKKPTKQLKDSYERMVFYLANAQRERFSRGTLAWDDAAANTARDHSIDMAQNGFFDHTNLNGEDPFDRMMKNHIRFYNAAENIAYGQVSPIYVHHSWMNSKSHRSALLGDYTRLGVGVAFHDQYHQPYYTQNFYTPR